MTDALSRYCTASEANDMEGLRQTLAEDVRLVSPISGRMVFKGRDDVVFLLTSVYGVLRDLRWDRTVGDDEIRVAVGSTKLLGVGMTDAMVFELAPDGRIRRIRPHLRPWLALTLFAVVLGPKVARRPGVVRRALAG